MTDKLLIIAPDRPTPDMLAYTRLCVTFIWYWHRGLLLLRDNHGVDALAAAQAVTMHLAFECTGVARRPRNGVSMRYYRQYQHTSRSLLERQDARDRHLIASADRVLFLDQDEQLMDYAITQKKALYVVEGGRVVSSW